MQFVIDTGPLVALFDGSEKTHALVVDLLASQPGWARPITNLAVVVEAMYLLKFSLHAQTDFLAWIGRAVQIDDRTVEDLPRIAQILRTYKDLPADFTDASLLALCERIGSAHVLTLDRDFDIYRLGNGRPLHNIFRAGWTGEAL